MEEEKSIGGHDRKMKIISLVILIFGIICILLGVFIYKKNGNDIVYPFNGLYQSGNDNLYIYQNDYDQIYYYIKSATGYASIDGKVANGKGLNFKYSFTLDNSSIVLETNNDQINSGTYQKIADLSLEEYYEVVFGDYSLINSKHNGLYESEKGTVYLIQTSDNQVLVVLSQSNNYLNTEFIIRGNYYEVEKKNAKFVIYFDEEHKYILFETIDDINNRYNNCYDGKYIKKSDISIKELLNNYISISS